MGNVRIAFQHGFRLVGGRLVAPIAVPSASASGRTIPDAPDGEELLRHAGVADRGDHHQQHGRRDDQHPVVDRPFDHPAQDAR